jgi:hypothetical protein
MWCKPVSPADCPYAGGVVVAVQRTHSRMQRRATHRRRERIAVGAHHDPAALSPRQKTGRSRQRRSHRSRLRSRRRPDRAPGSTRTEPARRACASGSTTNGSAHTDTTVPSMQRSSAAQCARTDRQVTRTAVQPMREPTTWDQPRDRAADETKECTSRRPQSNYSM